jgi:hypothetical protein
MPRTAPQPAERRNITQPADWWAAFETAAKEDGVTLSEWLGESGYARLSTRTRKQLSERVSRGQPRKAVET